MNSTVGPFTSLSAGPFGSHICTKMKVECLPGQMLSITRSCLRKICVTWTDSLKALIIGNKYSLGNSTVVPLSKLTNYSAVYHGDLCKDHVKLNRCFQIWYNNVSLKVRYSPQQSTLLKIFTLPTHCTDPISTIHHGAKQMNSTVNYISDIPLSKYRFLTHSHTPNTPPHKNSTTTTTTNQGPLKIKRREFMLERSY